MTDDRLVDDQHPPGLALLAGAQGHDVATHVDEQAHMVGQAHCRPADTQRLPHAGQIETDAGGRETLPGSSIQPRISTGTRASAGSTTPTSPRGMPSR